MKRSQFIGKVRRHGRKTGTEVRWLPSKGKGSHGKLWYGENFTTVMSGELTPQHVATMCGQLGVGKGEL